MKPKLSVVIPVRNEGDNLPLILKVLHATLDMPHEFVVVYDSLDDTSIPVLKTLQKKIPGLVSVHNTLGRGVPNALRAGVQKSQGMYILVIAADDMGPVFAIGDMMALLDGGCDFVSATRYAHGGRVLGGSFIGRRLSIIANRVFYSCTGAALTDSTFGIKMFRKDAFFRIPLDARPVGWVVAFEMSIKAQLVGLKLGEVPVISLNRFYGGTSTFRLGPWVNVYLHWFFWGVRQLLLKSKPQVKIKLPKQEAFVR